MKKNSNKNKETMISEDFEKTLREWKLPPSSASDIFEARGGFNCFPGSSVKTVEKEIRLHEGFATFPLISNRRRRAHQIWYEYLRVGMIQVGLKPGKLGSDASAVICVRDERILEYSQSIMGMVESSLCDGPIYFYYFPTHSVCLADSSAAFAVDVNIEGSDTMYGEDDGVTLVYKFHYKVMKQIDILSDLWSRRQQVDESGKTTLYLADIARRNRVVSKTISWAGTEVGEGLVVQGKLPSSGVGLVVENDVASSGDAKVDWKETLKAHVLKVDVPGFKKEEVRVEVEDGGIIRISGERSNEEEEEESDKWHCEERSGGWFLRRFKLPENAKLDGLKAGLENGVLTVTVPKEEVKKKTEARVIEITAS